MAVARATPSAPAVPRISVVMAVFNGERFLRESVDSILAQSFADFEFLIVDDGSTDATRQIIGSYTDPRIRLVVNEQNVGLTRSLNRGLRLARGEFIARQDADDASEPERFEWQVDLLDERPEVALLGTQYRYMDEGGRTWATDPLPSSHVELSWALLFGTPFIHSSVMFRRQPVLDDVGAYDDSVAHAQDYEYWNRIAAVYSVANLDRPLVRYRCHAESMTVAARELSVRPLDLLRASLLGRMLGWRPDGVRENAVLGDAMASLVLGWADAVEPSLLERAARSVMRLLDLFDEERKIPSEQAQAHASLVKRQLAERIVLAAANYSIEQPRAALRLWRLAGTINAPVMLTPRVIRKCGGRLLRGLSLRRSPASFRPRGSEEAFLDRPHAGPNSAVEAVGGMPARREVAK